MFTQVEAAMYAICSLLAVAIGFAIQNDSRAEASRKAAEHREQSIELNKLAAHIDSEADSRKLVDQLAALLKDELPPAWATDSVRQRLSWAEYKSATDVSSLIPEERIATVWNRYVREIGAPDEAVVTVAEIHNLRDAQHATGRMLWEQDINRSIWTIPNIVAVGSNGKVANGCRALEAIRVIYSMDLLFENVRGARKRVQEGIVLSDELAKRAGTQSTPSQRHAILTTTSDTNPIRSAQQRYLRERGSVTLNRLLTTLFSELFPDEQQ
jgi:hypothetical protein